MEQAGIRPVPIIEKSGEYFIGEAIFPGGYRLYRFSESTFSAKRYKDPKTARRKAKVIGGHVVWFNPINGTIAKEA